MAIHEAPRSLSFRRNLNNQSRTAFSRRNSVYHHQIEEKSLLDQAEALANAQDSVDFYSTPGLKLTPEFEI